MEGFDATESWGGDDEVWPGYNDAALNAQTNEVPDQDHHEAHFSSQNSGTNSASLIHNFSGVSIKVEQPGSNQTPAVTLQASGQQGASGFTVEQKPQLWPSASQSQMHQRSSQPSPASDTVSMKRKAVHMDALDCSDFAQTERGSMALKNPSMVRTSSKDSNRGLYPRPPRNTRGAGATSEAPDPLSSTTGTGTRTPKRSPSKITLSKEQMKNQTLIDRYFPVSPNKKAASKGPQSQASTSSDAPHFSASSPLPKKSLTAQFVSMGPIHGNTYQPENLSRAPVPRSSSVPSTSPTQRGNLLVQPSHQTCHQGMTLSRQKHPNSHASKQSSTDAVSPNPCVTAGSSENAVQTSPANFHEKTLTKVHSKSSKCPKPSPAKSTKSTVDSDIEDFENDTSWDGVFSTQSGIRPMYSSSQEGTPTKKTSQHSQNRSPLKSTKSTTESDIDDFLNDTSLDVAHVDQTLRPSDPMPGTSAKKTFKNSQNQSSARSTKTTTENDIDDFLNDSSLDVVYVDQTPASSDPMPAKKLESTGNHDVEAFENVVIDLELWDADSQSLPSLPSSQSQSDVQNPPNTFGLLGEGADPGCSYWDEEPSSQGLADLPVEVLERIFCFVPMMDACLRLSLVCKMWNEIISKEEFMPWKKTYHQLRTTSLNAVSQQLNLITRDQEETEDTCLLALVRNMPKFKAHCGSTMTKDLQKHSKYNLAKDIIKRKAPELLENEEPNPWSTISLLVILSETVQDVTRILECLLHPTATCTTMEVLECLYCIASHLLKYKLRFSLSSGCHYRIYHALYLFENSHSSVPTPGDGSTGDEAVGRSLFSRHRMPPTHEQCHIINHDIKKGDVVKIVAFAGTGKTTTLVKYAERRPNMSFLYVAFNKSVEKHAKDIFPSNVSSRTIHSMAYREFGWKYKNKLAGSFSVLAVHHELPGGERKEKGEKKAMHWLRYSNLVCKTLDHFCASADDFITTQHVPREYFKHTESGNLIRVQRHQLDHDLRMKIADDATHVWDKMINPNNTGARITHDVYLKLYQLSKPWNLNYNCLLIDEAQDLTPAQQDILLNQPAAKILVGDPRQQIYSFRGATDTMDRVDCEKTFHLTQSFRFGPEIAYIANCLLESASVNMARVRQVLIGKREPGHIDGQEIGQVAIITRTNISLFSEAVRIVEADSTTKIAFAGGIERYGMDVILDIFQLQRPQNERKRIQNSYIWKHQNFGSLKTYAAETDNVELLHKIKIVERYSHRIPELIELIRRRTRQESMADIVLSTVHKAKGLEFDTVKMTDDFGISEARRTPLNVLEKDELNMVYVAVTRAKKNLVLTNSLVKFISGLPSLERFAYPTATGSSKGQDGVGGSSVCIECKQEICGGYVVLLGRRAQKVDCPVVRRQGGTLCQACSFKTYPFFSCLI